MTTNPMDQARLEFWKPSLLAGLLAGLAASLPFTNCCCCLWPLAGGFLAVVLYRRQASLPPSGADGAVLGAISGVSAAIVRSVLLIPLQGVHLKIFQKYFLPYLSDLLEQSGDRLPPQFESLMSGEVPPLTLPSFFLDLFISALLFAGLAALGGIIAASLQKRRPSSAPEEFHGPQDPSHRQP